MSAAQMFAGSGFHYVEKWFGADSAVLEFAAEVDGRTVQGFDLIHRNDEGVESRLTAVEYAVTNGFTETNARIRSLEDGQAKIKDLLIRALDR